MLIILLKEQCDMSIKTLTITFFLTIIFSTVASAAATSIGPHPADVVRVVKDLHRNLPRGQSPLEKEWNQVCQRDVSCKWEGNRCTYKSNSVMKFHCETTTKNWANVVVNAKSYIRG